MLSFLGPLWSENRRWISFDGYVNETLWIGRAIGFRRATNTFKAKNVKERPVQKTSANIKIALIHSDDIGGAATILNTRTSLNLSERFAFSSAPRIVLISDAS